MSTDYTKLKTKDVGLTRFYGGVDRGVCLSVVKSGSWKGEYEQFTLQEAKKLKRELLKVKGVNVYYKIVDDFYLSAKQCKTLTKDLDQFINDPIHK